jgi:hypothetical protein
VIIDFNLLIAFLSVSGDKQNHVRGSKSTKISGRTFTQTSRQGNRITGYAAGSAWGAYSLENRSYALTDTRCYRQYEVVVWTSDIIARHGVEQFIIHQGFTNFPQNEEPPQNSMLQNG